MSKKEIRRAARDAFPKAKRAPVGAKGRTSGAYKKRTVTAGGTRSAPARPAVKTPSWKRSALIGVIMGVLYFVVIQWLWRTASANTYANVLISVMGALLFTGVNYLTEWLRYRRHTRKQSGSSK